MITDTETRTPAPTGKTPSVPVHERAWAPFWSLRNENDGLFDNFFGDGCGVSAPRRPRSGVAASRPLATVPTLDVIDKENEVKLIADLPGMTEKDINVEVTDSLLTISGEKHEEIEEGDEEGQR
ncbi:Hsp20 family protein [Maribius pontilimi]|uniref:Hsp20 family protein n=1 Tax=Palleronia pontilimi TaxID=1964209 RepID=A0A934MC92_9RHOB|nr:Hsp20 family protein [Palleronia pontilimi]